MEHNRMPLMRYFTFVGGALLALLFIANACLPASPVIEASRSGEASRSATDLSIIRIHSDRKWPERVVFDTTRPATIAPVSASLAVAPAAPMVAEAAAEQRKATAAPLKNGVREAFAQVPANSARVEPTRKRKSVARNYAGPPRILVAQQPPMVFFGNNIW
jgi:hypothetical protein